MDFYKPSMTIAGKSGNADVWIACVPCKIVQEIKDGFMLSCYDLKGKVFVSKETFNKYFMPVSVDTDFIEDFEVKPFEKKVVKKLISPYVAVLPERVKQNIDILIDKSFQDAYFAAGDMKNATFKDFRAQKDTSNLERFSPGFNRRARNCCPVPDDFDFRVSPSYPAPCGIRKIDFATKKEQNEVLKVLLSQIFAFANSIEMPKELTNYLGLTYAAPMGSHTCKYCGDTMDILQVCQKHGDRVQYLNLCHDDPKKGTRACNLYWGHTTCNREQGGYSIMERGCQGVSHLKNFLKSGGNAQQLPPNTLNDIQELIHLMNISKMGL
jgi:hypothetical protein